ncbi:hypothetical protein LCGC14_0908870 [marine sediment metagenome]|uniref:Uncharacterized protein n=1 Tax=marine sediment metagenome TaxID=412755 RepID=A0A0F9NYV2_9ZZZZ
MAIDLTVLRTELRIHLGFESDGTDDLSNDDADLLLNRAFWELLNKFNFREEECSIEFTVADGEDFISLPTLFESMRKLSILNSDTNKWTPLVRIDIQEFERVANDDTSAKGAPENYFREGIGIRLISSAGGGPDATYTLRIKYRVTLADLATSNTTLVIPDVWHELILMGGFWRGLHRVRDYEAAREVRNTQIGMINSTVEVEAKEEVDSPLAGIEIPSELTQI